MCLGAMLFSGEGRDDHSTSDLLSFLFSKYNINELICRVTQTTDFNEKSLFPCHNYTFVFTLFNSIRCICFKASAAHRRKRDFKNTYIKPTKTVTKFVCHVTSGNTRSQIFKECLTVESHSSSKLETVHRTKRFSPVAFKPVSSLT